MSASHAPALNAIALQLVVALEEYDRDAALMVDTWLDMDLYHKVSEEVEDIRRASAALPHLSVHWVEFLIAHAELVHALWRLRFEDEPAEQGRLGLARGRHAHCVALLKDRCQRAALRRGLQAR